LNKTKDTKSLFTEFITENSSNLGEDIDTMHRKHLEVKIEVSRKELSQCHTIMKVSTLKNKEMIVKPEREKHHLTYKGKYIRIPSDISI
jgi:translation initiation factor 6 (eIF-6)